MRAAEIDTLFTANVDQIVKADKLIKDTGKRVEGNPIKLDANGKPALESMDRVEQAAKKLVSKDTLLTVDANIERGEKSLDRVQKRLDYLRSVETTMDVKADTMPTQTMKTICFRSSSLSILRSMSPTSFACLP